MCFGKEPKPDVFTQAKLPLTLSTVNITACDYSYCFFPIKACTFCVLYLFSKQIKALTFFLTCHMDDENSGGSKINITIFPSILGSV